MVALQLLQMCIGLLNDTGLEELLVGIEDSKQRQTCIGQLVEMEDKVFDAEKQLQMCTGLLNDTGLEELLVGIEDSKQRQTCIGQLVEMEDKVFDAEKQLQMCTGLQHRWYYFRAMKGRGDVRERERERNTEHTRSESLQPSLEDETRPPRGWVSFHREVSERRPGQTCAKATFKQEVQSG